MFIIKYDNKQSEKKFKEAIKIHMNLHASEKLDEDILASHVLKLFIEHGIFQFHKDTMEEAKNRGVIK
jgi:hypothetical protein